MTFAILLGLAVVSCAACYLSGYRRALSDYEIDG